MAIQNNLPDPNNAINDQGQDSLGSYGPGFSSVKLSSEQPVVTNKSNSGIAFRTINRYHQWSIDIGYNEMTRAQFDVLYAFLMERQATANPFTVELPQYSNTAAGSQPIVSDAEAGTNKLVINNNSDVNVGDLFYIYNPEDDIHLKAYMVTRKGSGNEIYISPGLQRRVLNTDLADAVFSYPRVQVLMSSDNIDYSLNTNGLYSISLKLEETLV